MQPVVDAPVRGAQVTTADLVAARFASRLVNVSAPSRALAALAGQRRTQQRGRGLEFEEVRQYVPGDDVRAIDWRVTARSGEAHTKLFHEDHEQPITVALDLRSPMKFGSVNAFKSVLAAYTAALVLWSGLERGERVGAVILHNEGIDDVKSHRSRNTVLHALGLMAQHGQAVRGARMSELSRRCGIDQLFQELQRVTRPGGRTFVISDFHDAQAPNAIQALRRVARRSQLVAMHVSDPLEQQLPTAGRYSVVTDNETATVDTGDPKLRSAYAKDYKQAIAALASTFRESRVPLVSISTDAHPLNALQRLFPGR